MTEPLSALAFVGAARALVGLTTHQSPKNPLVTSMLRAAGRGPDDPWHVAFIHHVGWHVHQTNPGTSSWPFERTATCEAIAEIARHNGAVVRRPDAGDLALLWSPDAHAFILAGIVAGLERVSVESDGRVVYQCRTIEGDAMDDRRSGASCVQYVSRWIGAVDGDLVVRWVRLDEHQEGDRAAGDHDP